MKKACSMLTVFVLVLIFVLGLSACGKKKTGGAKKGSSNTSAEQSSAPVREEGVDFIDAADIEENAIQIDLETGKIISDPNRDKKTASQKETSSEENGSANATEPEGKTTTGSREMDGWEPLN